MAMSTGGGGGLTAEPNVTPMIDVLLVLLIIFMLIVPMARKAIDLQLPDPTPQNSPPPPSSDQIVLEVAADGSYKINTEAVAHDNLERRLHEIYDNRPDKVLFVKGDTAASYQTIMTAIDVARGSGWRPACNRFSTAMAQDSGCALVIGITPKAVK